MRLFSWQRIAWWAIVLLPPVLAFAVYWPYLDSNFANDDWSFLRGVKDGNLIEATARAFTFPPFTEFSGPTPFFRPLPDVAYKVFYDIFGLRPEPFHVINIIAHGVTAVAFGALVSRLSRSPLTGLAAAVLFVTWPSYESTVVWVSQLGELLCAAFGMTALVAFHRYLTCDRASATRWLALTAACMALAALSKQTATIFFAMIPLLTWAEPERRRSKRELLQAAAVIGAVAAVAAGLWIYEQVYEAGADQVVQYRLSRLTRYEAYLRHVIWPSEGSVRFQRVLEVLYIGLGCYLVATRRRPHAFFFMWSMIAVFPYAFPIGPEQPRYTYQGALPLWGLMAVLGRDVVAWASRWDAARFAYVLGPLAASAVAVTAFIAARETRDAQSFIESQARASTVFIAAVRSQCGEVPSGATIYVAGSAVVDPYGTNNRALVNMLFDKVYYRPVKETQAVQPPDCFIDLRVKPGA